LNHGRSRNNISTEVKMKKCPFCAELVQADAIKCKHCGEALVTPVVPVVVEPVHTETTTTVTTTIVDEPLI
jgi:hypothetical protein